jgi:hypothetical protein
LLGLLAVAAARPGLLHGGIAAPAVAAYAAPAVTAYAAPAVTAYAAPVATAVTKTVHYASTPVVTGYTSQVKLRTFSKGQVDGKNLKALFQKI